MLEIVVALLLVVLLTALALYEHERQPGETGAMMIGHRSGGDRGRIEPMLLPPSWCALPDRAEPNPATPATP